uniref:Uncharacterized protein n=1 Tax=Panagrolaimus sp. PS1159 TaxID=55785 RepID=A0AC35EYT7_9BILA
MSYLPDDAKSWWGRVALKWLLLVLLVCFILGLLLLLVCCCLKKRRRTERYISGQHAPLLADSEKSVIDSRGGLFF